MADPDDAAVPSLGFLIWHLSMRWQSRLHRELAPLGVTPADYALLASLHALCRAGDRPSQRALADASGLEPMYVSKLVRALERRGLVRRGPHPDDPRAREIAITDAGFEVVAAARSTVARLDDERLGVLGGAGDPRVDGLKASLVALLRDARGR